MSLQDEIASRRNWVRVLVTYTAAGYVFFGSGFLILALWIDTLDKDKLAIAKEIFTMVLPVATGIITYWFASRKPEHDLPERPTGGEHGRNDEINEGQEGQHKDALAKESTQTTSQISSDAEDSPSSQEINQR